jgi:D-3-phosphoglycerate dehydrogenase / 2-oxoglutarate reductase
MPRVLITPTPLKELRGAYVTMLHQAGFEIVVPAEPWDHPLNEAELFDALPGVDATIAGSEPYTARVLAAHPQLKVIARVGVGYDAIDVPAATVRGVAVAISPGANHETVAEHAFALLFALAKHVTRADREVREGRWLRRLTVPLRGQTLGILGLGRIGKAMVPRARAFGMQIIAHDVNQDRAFLENNDVRLVGLPELFRIADVVSLHAPMGPATSRIINADTLALMKPTAFLINTARGGLIDEEALVNALRRGQIAGAGLDVFANEPPPQDHPFFKLDNVVLTPHTGGTDTTSLFAMAELAARAIVDLAAGRWPAELIVNQEAKSSFRWT